MGLFDYYPQTQAQQQPDILGSYLRGISAPMQLQSLQQQNEAGQLNIDQIKMSLQNQGILSNFARQQLTTGQGGNADAGSGAPSVGRTGGIQNGPQDTVAGTMTAPLAPTSTYSGANSSAAPGAFPSAGTQRALAILSDKYDPVSTESGILEHQKQIAQLEAQAPLNLADTVITSDAPERLLTQNPSLMRAWGQYAPRLGLDPADPRTMTPQNVRNAATLFYNDVAGNAGLPPKAMPTNLQTLYGPNGQVLQVARGGTEPGKESQVVGQTLPAYSLQKTGYDPNTGRETGSMVMTSPGGGPAPGAPRGSGSGGGVGSPVGPSIDLGMSAPNDENLKSVGFASAMRQGLSSLRQIEQSGHALSPADRAVMINVSSDEDPDLLHQWFSQQVLAHKLTPQAQTYIQAAMPVIQALSHNQSGARLNGSTIRANLESAIPLNPGNPSDLQQIEAFRNGYYKSMLVSSGSAAYSPSFNDTLGADLRSIQSGQQLPGDISRVASDTDYNSLRPGWRFMGPDGQIRRKPQ